MYKLEYLKLAKDDINNIVSYISNNLNNKPVALNLIDDFIKEEDNIITFPYGNPEYNPIKH